MTIKFLNLLNQHMKIFKQIQFVATHAVVYIYSSSSIPTACPPGSLQMFGKIVFLLEIKVKITVLIIKINL